MISLIKVALQEAIAAFECDDVARYAFHTGKAGGVAAAVGAYGIKALSMCDDISDAYETSDSDLMAVILAEAIERLDNPDTGARTMDGGAINWPEYGAALNQAVEAKAAGDRLRYALMTGFVSGLLFNDPGPSHPEHGTILEAVTTAYETGSDESLQYAQARIGSGLRMTDPTPFMQDEQYNRYREERMRMMRWVQNFGLRHARAGDQRVAVPGSMSINDAARRQAREPDDVAALLSRGISKRERDDYDGAIADFDRAIELDADNSEAYSHRGSAKSHVGDIEGAIADFDRAIEIEPDNVGTFVSRAISKQNNDDHQGAIADWDRALEFKPDDGGWYVNRGMVKEAIGDYDGAIADYTRAIEVEPDYEVGYIARAYSRREQGDYEGAIADFGRVIELWPNSAAAYSDRGLTKSYAGDFQGAIADYDRAIELDPNDIDPQQNRISAIQSSVTGLMSAGEQVEIPRRPIDHCYWVIPGKLLAGDYPRTLDEESSKAKLAKLTDADVSAFIDLTEPNEPTRHGEPMKPYAYLLDGPSHQRFAIRDERVPGSEHLTKQALDAIDGHLAAGRTVYVHCWGGVGRTGTIIGCWLARHHEPGQAALDRLKELWRENPKSGWRRSPETLEQEKYVREWDEAVAAAAGAGTAAERIAAYHRITNTSDADFNDLPRQVKVWYRDARIESESVVSFANLPGDVQNWYRQVAICSSQGRRDR